VHHHGSCLNCGDGFINNYNSPAARVDDTTVWEWSITSVYVCACVCGCVFMRGENSSITFIMVVIVSSNDGGSNDYNNNNNNNDNNNNQQQQQQ
jgi:hypothetical protein